MYPAEVYVVAIGEPSGVFHYDPGRDELTDLGHPDPRGALVATLGIEKEGTAPSTSIAVTHRFCKNLYKYRDFAYRLGAVDVGVVLGRLLAEAGGRRDSMGDGEWPNLRLDFDDARWNDLLGLDGRSESVYGIIGLGPAQSVVPLDPQSCDPGLPSPPPVVEPGHRAQPSSLFAAAHAAASRMPAQLGFEAPREDVMTWYDPYSPVYGLPPASAQPALRRNVLRRASDGAWFTGAPLDAVVLATLLQRTYDATEALRRACADKNLPELAILCAVHRVVGIPPGAYQYRFADHVLVARGAGGDLATKLQRALHVATVDLERSSFSMHLATKIDYRGSPRAAREYRVQQIFVGAAIEAATRWSAAMGASAHPLLGFDAHLIDRCYGLDGPLGVQAQVSVGVAGPVARLEGGVIG